MNRPQGRAMASTGSRCLQPVPGPSAGSPAGAGAALHHAAAPPLARWLLDRLPQRSKAAVPTIDRPLTIELSGTQHAAVRRAGTIIDRRGGVLLADRTGTGKTFLAIALVERALANGATRVLITGPAGLAPQWLPLLRPAARAHGARVVSRRPPPGATSDDAGPAHGRPVVAWLSHTMLSLGRWPPGIDEPDFVVVDEAHAFRNPLTRRHRSLAWLCRNARVTLLTATPVNNSLLDLYALLRLFIGDGALDDMGVPDLRAAFLAAAAAGGPVRAPLDAAIDAVTVRCATGRRSPQPATRQPRVVVPVPVRYDLDADAGLVQCLIDTIRRLDLTPHGIGHPAGQRAGSELLRFALVKRLESSLAAFGASVRRLGRYLDAFADAARDGFWLSPASHAAFSGCGRDQLLLAPLALPRLPPEADPEVLVASARADATLLRAALDRIASTLGDRAPKTACLADLLGDRLAGRKVLVFTEYRDTAVHLWRILRGRLRSGLIHGQRALLGDQLVRRRDVVVRFAPAANGERIDPVEQVDILIATDVLAEGFNLQDAADVVSYDLPWNPVRLIQRVGRIDRVGSPHERIWCHNFMPDRTLDMFLGLVDRIGHKLDVIQSGPGRASLDRTMAGFHRDGRTSSRRPPPAARRAPAGAPAPAASGLLRTLADSGPGLFDEFASAADLIDGLGVPDGARELRDRPDRGPADLDRWWLAIIRHRGSLRTFVVRPGPGGPRVEDDPLGSAALLERIAAGETFAHAFVRDGSAAAMHAEPAGCARRLAGPRWRATAAAIAASDRLAVGSAPGPASAGRLVRDLLRIVAKEPGGADARLLARVDAVVDRLRSGLRSGSEVAAAAAIRRSRAGAPAGRHVARSPSVPGRAGRLVAELETIVRGGFSAAATPHHSVDPEDTGATATVAVFEIGPPQDPRQAAMSARCGISAAGREHAAPGAVPCGRDDQPADMDRTG